MDVKGGQDGCVDAQSFEWQPVMLHGREELDASLELLDSLAEEISRFLRAGDANESRPR